MLPLRSRYKKNIVFVQVSHYGHAHTGSEQVEDNRPLVPHPAQTKHFRAVVLFDITAIKKN